MKHIIAYCRFALLIICAGRLAAQSTGYGYSKEKIYIHTNHVFLAPGDQLFFKLYLVNGADNKPSKLSNVVFVEVLGPAGTVIEKQTYKTSNGYCEGSFNILAEAAGGLYKLKAYTSWMQNEKEGSFLVKEFTVQKILAPRILMRLDFPQKGYGAGDEVMADFQMRNLDNQPIRNYEGKFTVSLNGNTVDTSIFTTDAEGKAKLKFNLPQTLQTTDGLLNVTVNYDAYTESISRSIPITLYKIDLQFMPEGGSLAAGIATNAAFRAVNEYGKPVDVKGAIFNNEGDTIAIFSSYKFGMGRFLFTPAAGEVYHAKITSPKNIKEEYELPKAALQGVVMNITRVNDIITVKLTTTNDIAVKLVGQTKSVSFYSQNIALKKGINTVIINQKIFPVGIAQFTVYEERNIPVAERLVFLNEDKKLHVEITTDKQHYVPREKVVMTITTKDENGMPVPSNLSLAVVDDKLWTMADDKQDNIFSWLLMSSELKGKIEEPQFYFKKDEPRAANALDLVMLTHGYRYFDFIEYVGQNGELKYTPDEEGIVSGIITDEKDSPVAANVFLVANAEKGSVTKLLTGNDGIFYFAGLDEKTNYILLAHGLQKKERLKIKILQNGIGYNPLKTADIKKLNFNEAFGAVIKRPAKEEPQQVAGAINLKIALQDKVSNLDEIVVTGYTTARKRDLTGAVVVVGGRELGTTPLNGAMQALEGKLAGVQVTQNGPGAPADIRIRGGKTTGQNDEPLIVVNGVPQEKYDLGSINVKDIDNITVFKDAAAIAYYGAKAVNGVIAIQLKTLRYGYGGVKFDLHREYYYSMENFKLQAPAYTVGRRFYIPKYATAVTDERTDFRETVYWNPVVQTDREGKATVEFYNSDATTTFRAITEGIGYNGTVGRAEKTYASQSAMNVDFKIPPYLTVGDKAIVQLVIKNNSSAHMNAVITADMPASMQAGMFDSAVSIEADSAKQVLVPIQALAATSGYIRFNIVSEQGNDAIELPVTAAEKGFPVTETFSGNQTNKHTFVISKPVPGSLRAQLNIYKDVEGQLINGIEAMLREPYGCFEQTSSTTYPNVFILKYLRQAGKSNPAIEKKALGYIEEGYKRLIGFETSENGYEWFGHAPAFEALTAYGLLEFTDMEPFIKVDKAMLQRTKNLLLKRRDGQGGFTIAHHGYDEFAEVPNKIANIYIVYAISQAGYGSEIMPEYQAAIKKALESNDGYQLAMMALAADNMKDGNNYSLLMNRLKTGYQNHTIATETSIVHSRDASLRVEAMALYALALMRDTTPDVGAAADLISNILSEKSYYGYGSTQATLLALEAVTAYAKLAGEYARQQEMLFTINGKSVRLDDSIAANLHEGKDTFTVEYANRQRGIPYNLEVTYNTLTPPNSEKADIELSTKLNNTATKIGETVRLHIEAKNKRDMPQPMAIAKIGIPAGLSMQPWQLRELIDKNQVAYYEIFDTYLVLYWMGFAANETKAINLDLKAEVPGTYKAKASNVYLYYTPEYKHWNEGVEVEIK